MKRLSFVLIVCLLMAMVFPVFGLSGAAQSLVDESDVIVDLMPTEALLKDGLITCTDCELKFEFDGSVVIKITGSLPQVDVKWIDGGTIYAGGNIDLSNPAYFCLDFGVTGSAGFDNTAQRPAIFYYTRKDKAETGTLATLWYVSVAVNTDYVQYQKQIKSDETGVYVVWDWGTYIASSEAKLFDDKIHRFEYMELPLVGNVGDTLTLYSLCVVSNPDVAGLGDIRPDPEPDPEPTPAESSEEPEPVESSEEPEPVESSDEPEPVESSVEPEPVESSEEPEPAESSEEPAPVESIDEPAESTPAESIPVEESTPAEETPAAGFPWWGWLLIGVGCLAVVGVVLGIVLGKKKK